MKHNYRKENNLDLAAVETARGGLILQADISGAQSPGSVKNFIKEPPTIRKMINDYRTI